MGSLTSIFGIPSSAYIHIPFCRRRCFYCDFPIFVVGDTRRGENFNPISEYVERLCDEILITPAFSQALQTIFFGGGTPSLLSVEQLERVLNTLRVKFGIGEGAEISMEIDPGTFDLEHIQGYREQGITRVSLGVQAFQDQLLEKCGRSHRVDDIFTAVDLVRQVGFPELSIDLISGLPHQTVDIWYESLVQAIQLEPTHISIYDLTIEAGTVFGRYFRPGDKPLPSDETTAQMYRLAQQTLTSAGYEHYEISNYAKPGHQCRHNRVYWENRSYYGLGMGAASYVDGKRFTRPRKTKDYYQWLDAGAIIDCEITSSEDFLLETLMLGLRLADGLSLEALTANFGTSTVNRILEILELYVKPGWVEISEQCIRLQDPEGFLFSNVVLTELFTQLENP
ncbi:radical SAM family heme chaperone HemW [Calothrix sp. NIES-3974]|uniref:radical SAM family heme chaperone HemW n=1 Tax=Calothrix sp. NIES-3974 TaxID=2005462 RepID=UPI000B5DD3BD|nr:radical SAM family heme chaperone HemW [Calothrix sp. NIES-3974]BAZ05502.1 putative oxygen-independent coproporphyrinogen III oxidase [Calothrix sp. NIES-3974]